MIKVDSVQYIKTYPNSYCSLLVEIDYHFCINVPII